MKKGKRERIGHNHVIENRNLSEEIKRDGRPENFQTSLSLPVEQCIVDDAELRKKAGRGFEDEVQINDILSIRCTMLGEGVLAVAEFPTIKRDFLGLHYTTISQALTREREVMPFQDPTPLSHEFKVVLDNVTLNIT